MYTKAEAERIDELNVAKNESSANNEEMETLKSLILQAIGKENEQNFQLCIQVTLEYSSVHWLIELLIFSWLFVYGLLVCTVL